jgi:hypothetical protein
MLAPSRRPRQERIGAYHLAVADQRSADADQIGRAVDAGEGGEELVGRMQLKSGQVLEPSAPTSVPTDGPCQ